MLRQGLFLCSVLLIGLFSATAAQAQSPSVQLQGDLSACLYQQVPAGAGVSLSQWKNKMYTARMVYCMRELLREATKTLLNFINDKYGVMVLAASALFAFGMFGVKISTAMIQNLRAESFTFLFKIGFVLLLLDNTDFVVDFWFDTTDMLLELVASGMMGVLGSMQCPVNIGSMDDWLKVWTLFDCIFAKATGFGGVIVGVSLIGIAGLLIASGGTGLWLAFMAFATVYALAQFLFRCAMISLLSYGGLALMLLMLPLFLPLAFFKRTEDFVYKAWLPYAIGFTLQPALCIGFMLFALSVLDEAVMNGSGDNLQKYYNAQTHEVTYTSTATKIITGAIKKKAIDTWNYVWGIDPKASTEEQRLQVRKTVKKSKASKKRSISHTTTEKSFQERDCGELGVQQASDRDTAKAAGSDASRFKGCTDPKKCAEDYKKGLPNAPSKGSANTATEIACDTAKVGTAGYAVHGTETVREQKSVETVESLDLGANHEALSLEMLAHWGLIILIAGTFYKMIEHVPAMAESLSSSRAPHIGLKSPSIAGRSAAQRLQGGLENVHRGMKATFDKNAAIRKGKNTDKDEKPTGFGGRLAAVGKLFVRGAGIGG
jgi:hypothetical protein